ncbi:MAG: hypothetical protein KAR42_17840 [candidate division Zixibacteria bacterium]|nr:hypothetical protein [candidate division Zixibacteria bacterium]
MSEDKRMPLEQQEDVVDEDQMKLFDDSETERWREEWQGMPEFIQEDLTPFQSVIIHFETEQDRRVFGKLINQTLTYKTKSVWYPKAKIGRFTDKQFTTEQ